ncbi:MAG: hypothetical protein KTR16_01190 [Acidiferrobacterales bacterium]|nr:hypothetical protein [Acidiferrobacterales bacterium]
MNKLITASLVIVGLINFLPMFGVLGVKKLEAAYKISLPSGDVILLMQHRALLFGLLGGFILYSAFVPVYQNAAMLMAALSMIGFAVLVHISGSTNPAILKVLYIDYAGIFFLAVAIILKYGIKNS